MPKQLDSIATVVVGQKICFLVPLLLAHKSADCLHKWKGQEVKESSNKERGLWQKPEELIKIILRDQLSYRQS